MLGVRSAAQVVGGFSQPRDDESQVHHRQRRRRLFFQDEVSVRPHHRAGAEGHRERGEGQGWGRCPLRQDSRLGAVLERQGRGRGCGPGQEDRGVGAGRSEGRPAAGRGARARERVLGFLGEGVCDEGRQKRRGHCAGGLCARASGSDGPRGGPEVGFRAPDHAVAGRQRERHQGEVGERGFGQAGAGLAAELQRQRQESVGDHSTARRQSRQGGSRRCH
mmetsp:Transcript_84828/g.220967  ORF Transcript_84828/g.220967 Transcript_84828/m.220967 type:complete len:220 (-) Transcript_84828:92-751(-)